MSIIDHLITLQYSAGKPLGPGIHSCGRNLTHSTHPNLDAEQMHPLMATALPDGSFSQAGQLQLLRNG